MSLNNKSLLVMGGFCARGRIRTLNPQSRNLIFYPVELRTQDAAW